MQYSSKQTHNGYWIKTYIYTNNNNIKLKKRCPTGSTDKRCKTADFSSPKMLRIYFFNYYKTIIEIVWITAKKKKK